MIINDMELKPKQKTFTNNKTILLAWGIFDYLTPFILLCYTGYLIHEENISSFTILVATMAFIKLYLNIKKQNEKYDQQDGVFTEI